MLKKSLFLFGLLLLSTLTFAQSSRKLSKEEIARMTPEQKLIHETDRKSKHGKKRISSKEKSKIANRQDRRSRRIKKPK